MEPNPYESPKEPDPVVPEGRAPHWHWDNTQLLLGVAGILAGGMTFFATEMPPSTLSGEFKVGLRVAAGVLFVVGIGLMWGPISRHEDADDDEPSKS